jgi:hypothetical protein
VPIFTSYSYVVHCFLFAVRQHALHLQQPKDNNNMSSALDPVNSLGGFSAYRPGNSNGESSSTTGTNTSSGQMSPNTAQAMSAAATANAYLSHTGFPTSYQNDFNSYAAAANQAAYGSYMDPRFGS